MVFTGHAEHQMVERDVARFDVERTVKMGLVVMIESDPDGTERWGISGRDADGRRIEVVIEPIPPDMAVVITVIRVG